MFFRKSGPSSNIDSLIGARTRIEGDVFFNGSLRLDGSVRGKICALSERTGTLVVGASGRVDGEIALQYVMIDGTVNGTITGAQSVELGASARFTGELHYATIRVHAGAIVEGELAHQSPTRRDAGLALKVAANR